jgi:uncharacterized protein
MAERQAALITGASGGIGEALAALLAESKHDLLLVARTQDKLQKIAETLSAGHGIRVETLPLDLASVGSAERVTSFAASKGMEVDVLVNNAGYGRFGPFAESSLEDELGQIHLNVTALTHLTRLVVPGMIARRRGRILNVASTAAFQPGPLMAVYYATKAYVLSFSEALSNELKGTGVTATCLCPGPTRTGFMDRAGMGTTGVLQKKGVLMDASVVARRGYKAMMKGKRLAIPGVMNKLLAHATRLGPRGLNASVVRHLLEGMR